MADLDNRLRVTQSWWLASQTIRRHPELELIQTHPGGGQYDCLTVLERQRDGGARQLVQLNRNGSIHVGDHWNMTWEAERDYGDRHGALKRMETAAGLSAPPKTPKATPAGLAYRVIAHILAMTLNERATWNCLNQWLDTSGWECGPRFDLTAFPTVGKAMAQRRETDLLGQPLYRFWVLLKGNEPVAVLDTDGAAHVHEGKRDLPSAYKGAGRRLTRTVAAVLGDTLP